MSNELAIKTDDATLATQQAFELFQRRAKAVSAGDFLPEKFKNNVANCMFALELADRMNISWIDVMHSLHFVNGNKGWSATFIIARINSSGKFAEDLQFEEGGEGDGMFCRAWTTNKKGERLNGTRVSIAMAKGEGWHGKPGSKWKTMPEQMLRYRAATFFCRTYAPELLMSLRTSDELEDMKPAQARTIPPPNFSADAPKTPELASEPNAGGLGEIIDDE